MSDRVARVQLLHSETPLEPLRRLSAHLGGPRIYVKRDDEGGRGGGGNKLRKYERQLVDALAQGADTLLLPGHSQSSAARELVGAAAQFGLRVLIVTKRLVRRDTPEYRANGNALLLELLGAEVVELDDDEDFTAALARLAHELRAGGARPYVLPFGASDARGALGYVECAREIFAQVRAAEGRDPDLIAVATGSGGTQAGLVAGVALHGQATRVLGFTVLAPADSVASTVTRLATETLDLAGYPELACPEALVDGRARGEAYGHVTSAGLAAVRLLARLEGLFLDPVYTGKAMAGLVAYLTENRMPEDALVVFVHTGGLPLLFAYADAFAGGRER